MEKKPSLEGRKHLDSLQNGSVTKKLFNRDDDENLVRCTQLNSKNKISAPSPDTPKLKDASPLVNGMFLYLQFNF